MEQIIEAEELEVLHPEYNASPRVYYKNLYRYGSCFIGGSLAVKSNGVTDCLSEAMITLYRGSEAITSETSDAFGDFKIDGLKSNSGLYSLEISHPDHETNNHLSVNIVVLCTGCFICTDC